METSDDRRDRRIPPAMWIVLAVVIAASSIFSIPRIIRAYKDSGLSQRVADYRSAAENESKTAAAYGTLFFVSREEPGHPIKLESVTMPIETGSGLAGRIEALLRGPDLEILSRGLVTLVPYDTVLLGVRIVGLAAYIDISSPSLTAAAAAAGEGQLTFRLAAAQILQTAQAFGSIREAVILLEGNHLIDTRQLRSLTPFMDSTP